MANPEHLAILKQGVEVWNQWRDEHPEIQPNLSRANRVIILFPSVGNEADRVESA